MHPICMGHWCKVTTEITQPDNHRILTDSIHVPPAGPSQDALLGGMMPVLFII